MHRWLVVARGLRRAPHFSSRAAGGLLELSQLEGHANQATSFKKWVGMINVDVLPCSGSGGCLPVVPDHHELHGSGTRYIVACSTAVLSTFAMCVELMPMRVLVPRVRSAAMLQCE